MTRNDLVMSQATIEDVDAIRSLARQAYAKWVPIIGREPLPMSADYLQEVKDNRFDLLRLDGNLAAFIETITNPDHLMIKNIAVSPDFQGKGLARILMTQAERLATALGHDKIKLLTNKQFAENVLIYRKFGYKIDREEDFMGGITVYMSKAIQTQA